jgi:hypothetical protein
MNGIDITSIIGIDFPYQVFVCNSYGGECVYVATINANVAPPVIISPLPTIFENIPKIGIMIISQSTGCMTFKSITCESIQVDSFKFQDDEEFLFMDSIPYDFQT